MPNLSDQGPWPTDRMAQRRLSRDDRFIGQAVLLSRSRTCARRGVGCVLVDSFGFVLSTGFNGPASGEVHCIETPCAGALLPSGTGLDICEAIHGEENALIQCRDITRIHTAYCSSSPCRGCARKFLNTSCRRIVFFEEYSHTDAREIWLNRARAHNEKHLPPREWIQYSGDADYVSWLKHCPI
jgi:dCMP deaminase